MSHSISESSPHFILCIISSTVYGQVSPSQRQFNINREAIILIILNSLNTSKNSSRYRFWIHVDTHKFCAVQSVLYLLGCWCISTDKVHWKHRILLGFTDHHHQLILWTDNLNEVGRNVNVTNTNTVKPVKHFSSYYTKATSTQMFCSPKRSSPQPSVHRASTRILAPSVFPFILLGHSVRFWSRWEQGKSKRLITYLKVTSRRHSKSFPFGNV